ncbi:AraC family transcriptional regulator [Alloalcanivorax marinus]|uniref:AraC family transcriptional regulator n=1 Tax=Alloalcanivorax marinus TaxID=1177169 RepID=UPI001933FC55|nr:AraC family transcriptional regulator [Alloalcanivorax marinus]MBL7251651.1 helix-turn-helix transcriptional regulator [Alloalcanivorax marinus]
MTQSSARLWRDPRLPFVESRRATDSHACYRPHSHSTWSIGVVDRGRSDFSCPGAGRVLEPGTLISIPAWLPHACNPLPGRTWGYQMLYVDVAWMRRWAGTLPTGVEVRRDRSAYERFQHLNDCLFSRRGADAKAAALAAFLSRNDWRGEPLVGPPPAAPELEPVRRWLAAPLAETPSLPALAARLGLSRYQLNRRFQGATGMTPHAYRLDRRIDRARRLLREGAALTEVAHDLGFADQSHFQRAFKERVAMTPGAYQRPR